MTNVLRNLPSVNELLESPALRKVLDRASHNVVVTGVRHFLENLRSEIQTATADVKVPTPAELAERIAQWISSEQSSNLRAVINATGSVLHNGLGRAPLAEAAIQALNSVARNYSSLELELATGRCWQRGRDAEQLLRKITGAEAAVVVNNNAGATLLTFAALAAGREVIVSRGQVIEIGHSYRLTEISEFSGAKLREVGATNKTHIGDYRAAIRAETAALLRVHTSNFAIVGVTEQTPLAELVALGKQHGLPVIDDLGTGALEDLAAYGISGEPVVSESLKAGSDLVLFSGDKLVGGPQCGIIVGRKALVQKIVAHPLMRALRVDKLTLAALVATLELHQDRALAEQSLPVLSLLSTPAANLQNRAERLAPQLAAAPGIASAEPVAGRSHLGAVPIPDQGQPTWCIALRPAQGTAESLAAALRTGPFPVFGRLEGDRLLLDLRTVMPRQDLELVEALQKLGSAAPATAEPAPAAQPESPQP